jgi:hypothetical protein
MKTPLLPTSLLLALVTGFVFPNLALAQGTCVISKGGGVRCLPAVSGGGPGLGVGDIQLPNDEDLLGPIVGEPSHLIFQDFANQGQNLGVSIGGGSDFSIEDLVEATTDRELLLRDYSITDRISNAFFDREDTPGRGDGDPAQLWDVWLDGGYFNVDDDRWGRDGDGDIGEVLAGIHRQVAEGLIVGVAGGWEGGDLDTFGDAVRTDWDGWLVGPYVAYRASEQVFFDLWVGYAELDVDTRISALDGDYDVERLFVSANATGQWDLGAVRVRPRASVFYSDDDFDSFDYRIPGTGIRIPVDSTDDQLGTIDLMVEVNQSFDAGGMALVPFVRVGGQYIYQRPNGGKLLGDDLDTHRSSSYSGNARLGVRLVTAGNALVELSGGYLSIGKSSLNVFDTRLSAAFFF